MTLELTFALLVLVSGFLLCILTLDTAVRNRDWTAAILFMAGSLLVVSGCVQAALAMRLHR